jgi:hypothetical protein
LFHSHLFTTKYQKLDNKKNIYIHKTIFHFLILVFLYTTNIGITIIIAIFPLEQQFFFLFYFILYYYYMLLFVLLLFCWLPLLLLCSAICIFFFCADKQQQRMKVCVVNNKIEFYVRYFFMLYTISWGVGGRVFCEHFVLLGSFAAFTLELF